MGKRFEHVTKKDTGMANKDKKNWPLSLVTREILLETTMRHHYSPIRMATI